MENLEDWNDQDVLKWVESGTELKDKSTAVCRDLASGKYDISKVVEKLGPILTHKEAENRRKAVQFLTEVLSQVPSDFLLDTQLSFIVTFYADRLRDHHSLIPHLLAGINAFSTMKHVPEEEMIRLLFTVLNGTVITCQSQQREERSLIFDLIIHCSSKYHDCLVEKKNDFIQGVINAIEGERDPRNLLKLFNFMPIFVSKYPLEHWAEEMFEVFACYYPIDFYPSPNDPNAITRDVLSEKLDHCLLACRDFIEPALTLALEKLETQLKVAKVDSLVLIKNLAIKFGCSEIEEKFEAIWMGLKGELLPGQNDDVIRAALDTLGVIVREAQPANVRNNILTIAFNSIAISMCDISLRLFYPAIRIAHTMGNASPEAAVYIGDKVAPILLRQLDDTEDDNFDKTMTILGLLKDLLAISNKKNCLTALNQDTLRAIESIFVECLSKSDERISVGYFGLIQIASVTQAETRQTIYQALLESLRQGIASDIPMNECVLKFAASFEEELLRDFVTPIIESKSFLTVENSNKIFRTLCTLIATCKSNSSEIYKYLLGYIFQFPDTTLNLTDEMEGDDQSRILLNLLTAINGLLEKKENKSVALALYKDHNLIERLLQSRCKFKGDFILNPMASLMTHVMSGQNVDQQNTDVEKYLPQLRVSQNNDLYFIYGLLSRCPNEVSLDGKYEVLIRDLVAMSLVGGNPLKTKVCDHLLCFLFNRNYGQVEAFERILAESLDVVQRSMAENGHGIRTLAWVTKGLLTRGHSRAEELIEKIIVALQNINLSTAAADAFECLAKDPEIFLPNVRMFHKQKLFDLVCKNLFSSDSILDSVQLKAISRILGELSPLVLKMHLARVGPILFRCLDHQDHVTVQIALNIFNRLIDSDEKFCQDHLQFLIPQLLKLSQFKGALNIRIMSLECLLNMSKYPTYLLLPFKQDVLFNTIAALDDHKRLVRAAAVKTRTKWFLIDSPIKEK